MSARIAPEQKIWSTPAPTTAEQQALVVRIAASSQLNKSPRLTELLHYLTAFAWNETAEGLHEQEIGVQVFGRAAGYDTSQDNIVRVQVSQLRKKLEKYFVTEGAAEHLWLEIPRGTYLPVFHVRREPEARSEPVALPVIVPSAPRGALAPYWMIWSLLGAVVLLLGLTLWLFTQNQKLRRGADPALATTPALHSLWSRLFVAAQPTDIILADSMLSLFQDRLGKQLTLQDYLDRNFSSRLPASLSVQERDELNNIILRRYTSMADVALFSRLQRLAQPRGISPAVHFARDYQLRHLKMHNVILFGSKRSTPWIELFEPQMNFRFVYQDSHLPVVNRQPQPGEPARYEWPGDGNGYAILAFLPNLDRTGSVLILQGDDQIATEAAGEFVTSEEAFAKFQQKIISPEGRLPWFEVLLKTSKVGNASSSVEILASRLPQL